MDNIRTGDARIAKELSDLVHQNGHAPSAGIEGSVTWFSRERWEPGRTYWFAWLDYPDGRLVLKLSRDKVSFGVVNIGAVGDATIKQRVVAISPYAIGVMWPKSKRYSPAGKSKSSGGPEFIYGPWDVTLVRG